MRKHTPILKKLSGRAAAGALAVMLALFAPPLAALGETAEAAQSSAGTVAAYDNPLIEPYVYTPLSREAYPQLQNVINVLLMGFDLDYKSYAEDGGESHSDAMMVVSLHTDTGAVDLITLPRDTLTYVPGIRGMYKLNGAVNAGGGKTTESGRQKACEAASILLGNVPIDYYFAIEMEKVVDVVNLLGGIDVNVTYGFTTRDGYYYATGPQHLDGEAVYSYMRFRKSFEGTDIKRTKRQRDVISALIHKIQQQNLYLRLPEILTTIQDGYYTDIDVTAMLRLLPVALGADTDAIELYTMQGSLRAALNGWNIHFVDQDARVKLLKDVYGIDVKPLSYCSFDYCEWLVGDGTAGNGALGVIRYLYVTQRIADYAADAAEADAGIAAQRDTLTEGIEHLKALFCQTADAVSDYNGSYLNSKTARELYAELNAAKHALCEEAEALADATVFPAIRTTRVGSYGVPASVGVTSARWETDPRNQRGVT
jgi:LCP family protein required for cell wall assembly